jgi:hypothetical protein
MKPHPAFIVDKTLGKPLALLRNRYERQNGINQCTPSGIVAFCTAEFRETKSIVSF